MKLWDFRDRTDIDRLRVFYDAVAASGFALAVPRILEVAEVDGRMITVQARLHGRRRSPDADAVVDVLAALADVAGAPRHGGAAGARRRATLRPRRAVRAGPWPTSSSAAPPCWPATSARTPSRRSPTTCAHLRAAAPALVHGDLGPGQPAGRRRPAHRRCSTSATSPPSATRRSTRPSPPPCPTCSGPAIRRRRRRGSTRLTRARFGYDAAAGWRSYRAAYGLVTASCLVAASARPHFRWCLELALREALVPRLVPAQAAELSAAQPSGHAHDLAADLPSSARPPGSRSRPGRRRCASHRPAHGPRRTEDAHGADGQVAHAVRLGERVVGPSRWSASACIASARCAGRSSA